MKLASKSKTASRKQPVRKVRKLRATFLFAIRIHDHLHASRLITASTFRVAIAKSNISVPTFLFTFFGSTFRFSLGHVDR